ncbi:unnamed protein product [Effrenium voratum]|nr:unnamed protein product [Effrenium voratum]
MIVIEVDDVLEAGNVEHQRWMSALETMLKFGKAVELRSDAAGTGFAGRRVWQEADFSFSITMQDYIQSCLKPVRLENKTLKCQAKDEVLSAEEVSQLRGTLASINWVAREGRPDASAAASILAGCFPTPSVADAMEANRVVSKIKGHNIQLKIHSFPEEDLRHLLIADSSFDPTGKSKPQHGWLQATTTDQLNLGKAAPVSLITWRYVAMLESLRFSRYSPRQRLEIEDDGGLQGEASVIASENPTFRDPSMIAVIDAKSVFDSVKNEQAQGEDDRAALEVALIKESLSKVRGRIRWVPHNENPADMLTKGSGAHEEPMMSMMRLLATNMWRLEQEEEVGQQLRFVGLLLRNAVKVQAPIPLRVLGAPVVHAAADAFAEQDTAELDGWWLMLGKALCASNILGFEVQLSRDVLPRWFRASTDSSTQKSALRRWKRLRSSFWLRCSTAKAYASLQLWYACRSSVTIRESAESEGASLPVLQCFGYLCCRLGLSCSMSYVAGVRNKWADQFSRSKALRVRPENQRRLCLSTQPWAGRELAPFGWGAQHSVRSFTAETLLDTVSRVDAASLSRLCSGLGGAVPGLEAAQSTADNIAAALGGTGRQRSSSGGDSDGSLTRLPASMLQRLLVEPWHCQRLWLLSDAALPWLVMQCRYFQVAIAAHVPNLFRHLIGEGLAPELFFCRWLQGLFQSCLTPELQLRIWDLFIFERSFKVFVKLAVAIFALLEKRLIGQDIEKMMDLLFDSSAWSIPQEEFWTAVLSVKVTRSMMLETA